MNKKELRDQYKLHKPDMGVFSITDKSSGRVFLEAAPSLKAYINRTVFTLNAGMHRDKELQALWTVSGESGFRIETLEILPYSEDANKTDYSEDLEILRQIWAGKMGI